MVSGRPVAELAGVVLPPTLDPPGRGQCAGVWNTKGDKPACGNGNFLIEILRRKLQAHAATRPYFERDSDGRLPPFPKSGKAEEVVLLVIQAVSTINGFDIGPLQPGHPTRNKNRENCGSYCLDLPDYLVGHTVLFIERLFGVRDDGA